MAPEDPPFILPTGGPRTTKKRKRVNRISFENFVGEDNPLDQQPQGSSWQVAAAQGRRTPFDDQSLYPVGIAAEEVETQERSHEGQINGPNEPEHTGPLENKAPMLSGQADHGVQVSATKSSGSQDMEKAGNQGMETANSSLVHSHTPDRLSETYAMANSRRESVEGAESDPSYAMAPEEEHQNHEEGNRAYNPAVASPPTIQVQRPTPPIAPARIAQYLEPRPLRDSQFLAIPGDIRNGFSGTAADQSTTGRGDAEASNHNLEAAIDFSTGNHATGAGQLTDTTDGVRTSAGTPVMNASRQELNGTVHGPRHNQVSRESSEPTSERSAYNIGDHSDPDQAIGASARPTSGQNITSTEEHANDGPLENIRPTPQNLRYGTYPNQPGPQNRNPPLGSSRLQNTTKLGAYKLKFP